METPNLRVADSTPAAPANYCQGGIYLAYKYVALKVHGKRIDEHRYVMEQHLGRELDFNEVVHHRNEIRNDNRRENLEVQARGQHGRMHLKGRVLGSMKEETRQKISAAKKGKPNTRDRKLDAEQVRTLREFYVTGEWTNRELAEIFGLHHSTIQDILSGKTYKDTFLG